MKNIFYCFCFLIACLPLSSFAVDTLYMHVGDTLPYYPGSIRSSAGVYDLTGSTVTAYVLDASGNSKVAGVAAVITSATKGEFEYRWDGTDTDTAGTYTIFFRVTVTGGRLFTVPAGGTAKIIIE